MKTALPWLVAVIGIAAAAYFFNANKSTTAQVATLQQEVRELQPLRTENATLKTNIVPAEELARLRKDSEDALRLRNEVRQLRETKTTLTQQAQTAQTAAQQAHQQAAQAQAEAAAANQRANTSQTMTVEQAAAIAARYGLTPTNSPVDILNACINNLRQLDGAKQQWALEKRQIGTVTPAWEFLLPYLKAPAAPRCPGGGRYTINAVDTAPTCTIPGHTLPQSQ